MYETIEIPDYTLRGDLLWEIYRNGAIHLYSPKVLKDKISGSIIGWITYKRGKVGLLPDETPVIHLVPHFLNDNTWEILTNVIQICLISYLSTFEDHQKRILGSSKIY